MKLFHIAHILLDQNDFIYLFPSVFCFIINLKYFYSFLIKSLLVHKILVLLLDLIPHTLKPSKKEYRNEYRDLHFKYQHNTVLVIICVNKQVFIQDGLNKKSFFI